MLHLQEISQISFASLFNYFDIDFNSVCDKTRLTHVRTHVHTIKTQVKCCESDGFSRFVNDVAQPHCYKSLKQSTKTAITTATTNDTVRKYAVAGYYLVSYNNMYKYIWLDGSSVYALLYLTANFIFKIGLLGFSVEFSTVKICFV